MKIRTLLVMLAGALMAVAEPAKDASPDETSAPQKEVAIPDVEAAIPAPVKALGKPTPMKFPGGIQMAVTASTDEVQAYVNQGMNHLHGGWEFEASRNFAAAMREDPECLLAHWGMMMCMLNPTPENDTARAATLGRLLSLIEQGNGTDLERGYAYGLIKYIEEGPVAAASAFRKISARFPNELQASIFAALFIRSGYDDFGSATPDQEAAEKSLLELIQKNPQSTLPINALLFIRAEGPDLSKSLDLANKLCQMFPDYPPYFHLLGHYQWRSGNHGLAASAFGRASSFYQKWMKDNQATIADCPEWVKAECYRIVSVLSKGDSETAYAAARQVASTPLPEKRPSSPGARFLLWDAKTLPARILLQRGNVGNAEEAALSLPKPDEVAPFRDHSLAYWWIDGLRFALEAQRQMDKGAITEARNVAAALTMHGEAMSKGQSAAFKGGERSEWTRSFRALEVLASDIRGRLAMAGPIEKRETAYNWFSSAADRQRPSPMLFPPMILSPMSTELGKFYLATNKPPEAIEALQEALLAFPNDMNSLVLLKQAYEDAKMSAEAASVEKKIQILKTQ